MPKALRKKIRNLSKILKWSCRLGMVLFPVLTVLCWVYECSYVSLMNTDWKIQVLDISFIPMTKLSFAMKMKGIGIDMIPFLFFVGIFFVLAKLFRQYEQSHFFSRQSIRYLRCVASLLIGKIIVYPFYLALRNSVFQSAGHPDVLKLAILSDFKSWILVFALFLLAYIMEIAFFLEEEVKDTI